MNAVTEVSEVPEAQTDALTSLASLHRLTLEAGLSESRDQLVFRILNRSIIYCHYDRAILWNVQQPKPKLLGVSGNIAPNLSTALADQWRDLVCAIPERGRTNVIRGESLGGLGATWTGLSRRTNGLSVLWLPLSVDGRVVAGLWLERWGDRVFSNKDAERMEALGLAYSVAWKNIVPGPGRLVTLASSRVRAMVAVASVVLVAAFVFVRVPLRIVAPCEVVAQDPIAVTAPLAGVIDEVVVLPGRTVKKGDLLAVYDQRVPREELKVAQEQVRIVESDLRRSRVQAFNSDMARSEVRLLENRLAQERIRLSTAQYRVGRLEIRAPAAGTLMLNDPHSWTGRPVQVGERLMMIVDPQRTRLRIELPQSDNIVFDLDQPLAVVLDAEPGANRFARLEYVASHSETGRDQKPYFRAEAAWVQAGTDVKMGLQGTAVIYGERVRLGYWLLRRPLGAIRRHLGV